MFPFIKKIWHGFLVFSLAIVFSYFFLFLFFHPLNLVFFLGDKLSASTGVTETATVPENPINQLALQLDAKENQLNQKEQSLNNLANQISTQNFWNSGLLLAIFLALGILAALVILNFYFDRRRENELEILAQRETKDALLKDEKK